MGIDGFDERTFTFEGATRAVFRRARARVVVMHEIPHPPRVIDFATRLADSGSPWMLTVRGRPAAGLEPVIARMVLRACVSREFASSPRAHRPHHGLAAALCRTCTPRSAARRRRIGMCPHGQLRAGPLVDEAVMAPS